MIAENLLSLKKNILAKVTLVAVSKFHPESSISEAYQTGHRAFGENRVQELVSKYESLPKDIEWHLLGTLQRNKAKYIVPFIHLIHSVDSESLLAEINKEAQKIGRKINVLLQIYIAKEESKHGLSEEEALDILNKKKQFPFIQFSGLMGMATNTENQAVVRNEFKGLSIFFNKIKNAYFQDDSGFKILSMGMSGDYELAIEEGSTMVRIGSAIFGNRN